MPAGLLAGTGKGQQRHGRAKQSCTAVHCSPRRDDRKCQRSDSRPSGSAPVRRRSRTIGTARRAGCHPWCRRALVLSAAPSPTNRSDNRRGDRRRRHDSGRLDRVRPGYLGGPIGGPNRRSLAGATRCLRGRRRGLRIPGRRIAARSGWAYSQSAGRRCFRPRTRADRRSRRHDPRRADRDWSCGAARARDPSRRSDTSGPGCRPVLIGTSHAGDLPTPPLRGSAGCRP